MKSKKLVAYSEQDIATIFEMVEQRKSWDEIARALERTKRAVKTKHSDMIKKANRYDKKHRKHIACFEAIDSGYY